MNLKSTGCRLCTSPTHHSRFRTVPVWGARTQQNAFMLSVARNLGSVNQIKHRDARRHRLDIRSLALPSPTLTVSNVISPSFVFTLRKLRRLEVHPSREHRRVSSPIDGSGSRSCGPRQVVIMTYKRDVVHSEEMVCMASFGSSAVRVGDGCSL
jgi:hypothetical protein